LDLYVHEIVAQKMLDIFHGRRKQSDSFSRFQISGDVLMRVHAATSLGDASSAFDLEVRGRLGFVVYQDPDKIADGMRLISDVELWNEIALMHGASPATKIREAQTLKRGLS